MDCRPSLQQTNRINIEIIPDTIAGFSCLNCWLTTIFWRPDAVVISLTPWRQNLWLQFGQSKNSYVVWSISFTHLRNSICPKNNGAHCSSWSWNTGSLDHDLESDKQKIVNYKTKRQNEPDSVLTGCPLFAVIRLVFAEVAKTFVVMATILGADRDPGTPLNGIVLIMEEFCWVTVDPSPRICGVTIEIGVPPTPLADTSLTNVPGWGLPPLEVVWSTVTFESKKYELEIMWYVWDGLR